MLGTYIFHFTSSSQQKLCIQLQEYMEKTVLGDGQSNNDEQYIQIKCMPSS